MNEIKDKESALMVASYPKSGNTWIRHILSSMIDKNYKSLQDYTPSMHTKKMEDEYKLNWKGIETTIVKTHHNFQHKNLENWNIEGAIHIVRNPMDVLLSSLNFLYLERKEKAFINSEIKSVDQLTEDGELPFYIEQFIDFDGVPFYEGMTSKYTQNFMSWKQNPNFVTFTYEELLRNPIEGYSKIAEYMGFSYDENHIRELIQIVEGKTALNNKFFWKKTAGNYNSYFNQEQINKFESAYSWHPSFEFL